MSKQAIEFQSPYLNAAGFMGFSPDKTSTPVLSHLGGFFSNPVSLQARQAANGTRIVHFAGGVLIHTGAPNPGISKVLAEHLKKWQRLAMPVIVHLVAENPRNCQEMVVILESQEGIAGIEVSLPKNADPADTEAIVKAANGELPLIVQVPANESVAHAHAAQRAGASMISMAAPRGTVKDLSKHDVNGRLFGPAVFPDMYKRLIELLELNIPVIASGGIFSREEAEICLDAGATAVQLDSVLWRAGFFDT